MKMFTYMFAAVCLTALLLAPARGQYASPPEDLSQYDTADALWAHISARGGAVSGPGAVTTLHNEVAAATEFESRYPEDSRHWGAELIAAKANLALTNMGQGTVGIAEIQNEANGIANASDASAETKTGAVALLRQIKYAEVGFKIRQVQALEKTDPSGAEAMLAGLLNDPDPDTVKMAHGEELREAAMKQPMNLAFTAVDGSEVDMSRLRGKVVLVDFWATWCHPCMMEAPNVVAAYNQLHDQGFEIVGISLDHDREKLISVTAEKGMVWPQYFDGLEWQNKISTSYGIGSVPTMWLVNKQGILVDTDGRTDLVGKIEKLLQE